MKLSEKQKQVINLMRDGRVIHWMDGLNPSCFLSDNCRVPISTATCLRLEELGFIESKPNKGQGKKYYLTNRGKYIQL